MKEIFYIDAHQIAERTAEQVAKQKNPETIEAVSLKDEKRVLTILTLLIL